MARIIRSWAVQFMALALLLGFSDVRRVEAAPIQWRWSGWCAASCAGNVEGIFLIEEDAAMDAFTANQLTGVFFSSPALSLWSGLTWDLVVHDSARNPSLLLTTTVGDFMFEIGFDINGLSGTGSDWYMYSTGYDGIPDNNYRGGFQSSFTQDPGSTPVPEPSALLLLSSGGAAISLLRLQRRSIKNRLRPMMRRT